MKRPDWNEYFLAIARVVSTRSHDIHTQHGCVITHNNRIIGTGYNGFPHDMPDGCLPTTRPEKYDWMEHAEVNACANVQIWPSQQHEVKAYITGEPCFNCLKTLWRHKIGRIYYPKGVHG